MPAHPCVSLSCFPFPYPVRNFGPNIGQPTNVAVTSSSSAALQQESFPRQENPSHPAPGGPEPIPLGGNSANALGYVELEENSQNPDLARSYAAGGQIPRAILGRLDTNSPQDRSQCLCSRLLTDSPMCTTRLHPGPEQGIRGGRAGQHAMHTLVVGGEAPLALIG